MINILKLNHIAIACKDTRPFASFYRDILKAKVSERLPQPEHGVYTTFVEFGSSHDKNKTKLELIEPLGESSPIAKFVMKNDGQVHHFCFEVDDLPKAMEHLASHGIKPPFPPRIGAHNLPIVFLHPRDCKGILTELEQINK
jgi:methylmalonyl-CoA/ethylmalonyl-CoA epimerase